MPTPPDWISAKEAARMLGIHPRTLLNWHRNGGGPPCYATEGDRRGQVSENPRTLRRYKKSEVAAWLSECRREG